MNETAFRVLTLINTILLILAISMFGVMWKKLNDTSPQIPSEFSPPSLTFEKVQELFKGFAEYYESLPEERRACIQKNVFSPERLSQLLKDSPTLGSISLSEEETLEMQNCIRQYQ